MATDETAPLPVDPARQADPMLRACEYQILQTVSAWLDLRDHHPIYVEGAEDFDIHTATGPEAVQVKTSPDPISLGQKPVIELINNYWRLRTAAGVRAVKLRILTRASATVERGSPFGVGVAGLHLWQRRQISDGEALQLRGYLGASAHVDAGLAAWLRSATAEEMRAELLQCITWQTEAVEAEMVDRIILNKLAALGAERGPIPASLMAQLKTRLVDQVWKALRGPHPRMLDRFLLEQLWEEVARVSVPRAAADAFFNQNRAATGAVKETLTFLLKGTPPLPGAVAQRTVFVKELRRVLGINGFLNLHGSSRMGKTTLAKLVAAPDAEAWRWWSGARRKVEEIAHELAALVPEVAKSADVKDVVLDDIDLSALGMRSVADSLMDLLAIIGSRRGRVVLTSQRPLRGSLLHTLGYHSEQIIAVPRLHLEEVKEMTVVLGCSNSERVNDWAPLVHASTDGHPQLTAVRLLALKEKGWPPVSVHTFESGIDAVDGERADARELLELLPASQRELLERLSVLPLPFRRDHALALANVPPPIGAPGNVFDPLVGPWVEPLHAGYYALSPLLFNAAHSVLARSELRQLQEDAALMLGQTGTQTDLEFAAAFTLSFQGRNEGLLTSLIQVDVKEAGWGYLAGPLRWLTFFATQPGQHLFPENELLSMLLRRFQFRIALHASPDQAARVVAAWNWEVSNCSPEERRFMPMIFAVEILPHSSVPLPGSSVVKMLRDVAEAAAANPDMPFPSSLPGVKALGLVELAKLDDFLSTLSYMCSPRCVDKEFLEDFMDALEATEEILRRRILKGFAGGRVEAEMAVDRTWIAESEKAVPDWDRCLLLYERLLKHARLWNAPSLAVAAMRAACIVLDEYVGDHLRAHQTLDKMSQSGDLAAFAVHDRRGSIFFSEGNYAAAEEQWRSALTNWPGPSTPFDSGAAFAARNAGVSAARQGRWEAAAMWFCKMVDLLPIERRSAFVAGAHADAAYCFAQAGQTSCATEALVDAWQQAEKLPKGKDNFRAFVTRRAIGLVVAWIHGKVTATVEGLTQPIAGMCSSAELPEKMRDLPEIDSAHVWLFLMRLERATTGGTRAVGLGAGVLGASTDPRTVAIAALEKVAQALTIGNVASLPKEVMALSKAVHAAALSMSGRVGTRITSVAPEAFDRNEETRGAALFIAGLVVGQAHGRDWRGLLEDWRHSLPEDAGDGWDTWFETIEGALGATVSSAMESLGRQDDWAMPMLAAWNLLTSEDASPEQVFCAHARWLTGIAGSHWLQNIGKGFCKQVEATWQRRLLTPALLRLPRLSIPAISAACSEGEPSTAKAARILLAAATAVNVRLSPQMTESIRNLGSSPVSS